MGSNWARVGRFRKNREQKRLHEAEIHDAQTVTEQHTFVATRRAQDALEREAAERGMPLADVVQEHLAEDGIEMVSEKGPSFPFILKQKVSVDSSSQRNSNDEER